MIPFIGFPSPGGGWGGGGGDSQKSEFIYPGWKEENEKEGVKKVERWSKRFENGSW